jgi:hypothetical protein
MASTHVGHGHAPGASFQGIIANQPFVYAISIAAAGGSACLVLAVVGMLPAGLLATCRSHRYCYRGYNHPIAIHVYAYFIKFKPIFLVAAIAY